MTNPVWTSCKANPGPLTASKQKPRPFTLYGSEESKKALFFKIPRQSQRRAHERTISLNSELSIVRSPASGTKFSCGETQITKRALSDEEEDESDIQFTGGQTMTSELNLVTEEELTPLEVITNKEPTEPTIHLVENLEVVERNTMEYDTRRSTKAGTLESGRSSGRSLLTKYLENNPLKRARNEPRIASLQQSQYPFKEEDSKKEIDKQNEAEESVTEGLTFDYQLRAMTENAEQLSRPCSQCEKNLQKNEELQKALYRALDLSSALLGKVVRQERELQKHRSLEPRLRNQIQLK